jgi:hypothetical protein
MTAMPPTKYILETLQADVLPAAGGAALVLCLFLLLGRWSGALGSAAAIVVAFLAANFTLADLKGDDKPTWENTGRLISWKPAESAPGWQALPRAALLMVVVGLLSRWIGLLANRYLPERYWWGANLFVWAPRLAVVIAVSGWLAAGPAASKPEWEWLRLQLILSIFAVWIALDGLARDDSGTWTGAEIAAYLSVIFLTAGAILLYTHNAKFMDLAVILGCGMFGIAVVATLGGCDTSGAVPACAAFLPGLIFGTRPSMVAHVVPSLALWLVALAPLVLLPFTVPALARGNGWMLRIARVLLILAPLITAIVLASQHEKLAFDEEY